jgi:hypothetical protein
MDCVVAIVQHARMNKVTLCVQGLVIEVTAQSTEVAASVRHDFYFFLANGAASPGTPAMRVVQRSTRGPSRSWAPLFSVRHLRFFVAPRGARRVSLFDRAWIDYRYRAGRAFVFCNEPEPAYEACMQVLQSYIGEALGRRGLHRIHGVGLSFAGEGAVLLGASGTGKSTLLLETLKSTDLGVLSDDTPLIASAGARGDIIAYPQRIAIREASTAFDPRHVRKFRRQKYGEKLVISTAAFADRIVAQAPAAWLVTMSRRGAKDPELKPISRMRMVWPLIRWLVIGHETPQVWELFVRLSPREVAVRIRILASRLRAASTLLASAKTFAFALSPDSAANAALINRLPEIARGRQSSTTLASSSAQ